MTRTKCLVSRDYITALGQLAEEKMERDPPLREQWLDNCRTSGLVKLDCDLDWVAAWWLWYNGRGATLRRERMATKAMNGQQMVAKIAEQEVERLKAVFERAGMRKKPIL